MDPFTAIGLAAAVCQFVDFGTKLIKGGCEIYYSTTGTTEENASLETIISELSIWSTKLSCSGSAARSEERAIRSLAGECQKLSRKILEFIEKGRPKNQKSRIQVVFAVLRGKWHDRDKRQLLETLEYCRSQLSIQLAALERFLPINNRAF